LPLEVRARPAAWFPSPPWPLRLLRGLDSLRGVALAEESVRDNRSCRAPNVCARDACRAQTMAASPSSSPSLPSSPSTIDVDTSSTSPLPLLPPPQGTSTLASGVAEVAPEPPAVREATLSGAVEKLSE
jgi:hypothetical protein